MLHAMYLWLLPKQTMMLDVNEHSAIQQADRLPKNICFDLCFACSLINFRATRCNHYTPASWKLAKVNQEGGPQEPTSVILFQFWYFLHDSASRNCPFILPKNWLPFFTFSMDRIYLAVHKRIREKLSFHFLLYWQVFSIFRNFSNLKS